MTIKMTCYLCGSSTIPSSAATALITAKLPPKPDYTAPPLNTNQRKVMIFCVYKEGTTATTQAQACHVDCYLANKDNYNFQKIIAETSALPEPAFWETHIETRLMQFIGPSATTFCSEGDSVDRARDRYLLDGDTELTVANLHFQTELKNYLSHRTSSLNTTDLDIADLRLLQNYALIAVKKNTAPRPRSGIGACCCTVTTLCYLGVTSCCNTEDVPWGQKKRNTFVPIFQSGITRSRTMFCC